MFWIRWSYKDNSEIISVEFSPLKVDPYFERATLSKESKLFPLDKKVPR